MASTTNVIVVSDKPPSLGRITGDNPGPQIQESLRDLAQWTRRHAKDGRDLPRMDQLIEEADLSMLRSIQEALFKEDDKVLHPDDYRALVEPEVEEQDSAQAMALRRLATRAALRGETISLSDVLAASESSESAAEATPVSPKPSRKAMAQARIDSRHAKLMENIYSEQSLTAGLRMMYGPQTLVQAEEILKEIKMNKGIHYRNIFPATEYVAQYDSALQWIQDVALPETIIISQFIKGIQPSELARELELRKFSDYATLKNQFEFAYFTNFRSTQRLGNKGGNDNTNVGNKSNKGGQAATAPGEKKSSAPGAAAATTGRWSQAAPTTPLRPQRHQIRHRAPLWQRRLALSAARRGTSRASVPTALQRQAPPSPRTHRRPRRARRLPPSRLRNGRMEAFCAGTAS